MQRITHRLCFLAGTLFLASCASEPVKTAPTGGTATAVVRKAGEKPIEGAWVNTANMAGPPLFTVIRQGGELKLLTAWDNPMNTMVVRDVRLTEMSVAFNLFTRANSEVLPVVGYDFILNGGRLVGTNRGLPGSNIEGFFENVVCVRRP